MKVRSDIKRWDAVRQRELNKQARHAEQLGVLRVLKLLKKHLNTTYPSLRVLLAVDHGFMTAYELVKHIKAAEKIMRSHAKETQS
jgi:hypothetical protein